MYFTHMLVCCVYSRKLLECTQEMLMNLKTKPLLLIICYERSEGCVGSGSQQIMICVPQSLDGIHPGAFKNMSLLSQQGSQRQGDYPYWQRWDFPYKLLASGSVSIRLEKQMLMGISTFAQVLVLSYQSCPTLCDPVNCSLPGSSVHGIFQARILEWVAISFSWIST